MTTYGTVYLIPSVLDEKGYASIPFYTFDTISECQVFFVENERTARRYIMQLRREIPIDTKPFQIDEHEWFTIHKAEEEVKSIFIQKLKEGKNIGIISEAGCPGIADPGQVLIAAAHDLNVKIKPLVGPSSILLALMASGLNGQQFQFNGYLPIDNHERMKTIKELELDSIRKKCTQIFIETPYRNNQLLETILKNCKASTRICIAANLTGEKESIATRTVTEWNKSTPDLHKQPVIFLMLAS
jgi:16S rRNA (cytidine1402-2'-O)-methyltransferase